MAHPGKPDTKQYLQELITDYQEKLKNPFWQSQNLHNFIQEELYKCTYRLDKIKETDLLAMMDEERIAWFYVSSNNYESIHNHDAYAKIERGVRGPLLTHRKEAENALMV